MILHVLNESNLLLLSGTDIGSLHCNISCYKWSWIWVFVDISCYYNKNDQKLKTHKCIEVSSFIIVVLILAANDGFTTNEFKSTWCVE